MDVYWHRLSIWIHCIQSQRRRTSILKLPVCYQMMKMTWKRSSGQITVDTPGSKWKHRSLKLHQQSFCLFRTKGGYLYETRSEDGGDTWSPSKPSPLTSPESMSRMIKLKSGRLLVGMDSVSSTTQQPGIRCQPQYPEMGAHVEPTTDDSR